MHPLVSVIIPNYNYAHFIPQRIGTVLGQTYRDIELIILDDASTDNSREAIEKYRGEDRVKHIVFNTSNSGSTFKQWEKGFQLTQGEYIWIAESDDYCDIRFLEVLVDNLVDDKVAIVYSKSHLVDSHDSFIKKARGKGFTRYSGCDFIRKKMGCGNEIINASAVIFNKKCLSKIPNNYSAYKAGGDYLFWIYLAEQGLLSWADDFRIYDAAGTEWTSQKVSKLICGTKGANYYLKDGKVAGAIITQTVQPENIRVLIGGAGQTKVTISAEGGFTLKSSEAEKTFSNEEQAVMTADLPWFDSGIVEAAPTGESPLSVTFSDGTKRQYFGTVELERRQDGISVINELPLETYLRGVVPHEMPVDFGETALEAQAITARSYAYNQFYANSYCGYGAHLADTVASQVYLGADTAELSDAAIQATAGKCLTAGNEVVTTYFYSTSCGYGADAKEVWSADGTFTEESKAYLTGGTNGISVEKPNTEEEWLAFWQDWEIEGYDDASPWYRWKTYFGAGQLTEITGAKLKEAAKSHPAHVEVLQEDGSWKAQTPEDLGRLTGISVAKRGESGVMEVLRLDYEKGSVQVKTEYTIRQALSPTKMTVGDPI